MVPQPDRTQPEDRMPGLPGTDPAAIDRPTKGLFAVLRGLLVLFAVHPLTLAILAAVLVWVVSRWL